MSQATALFEQLLRLGDNALILSQRLSAWCGHGPILEEDIALTNVALDLLGHARMWLDYAAEVEGVGRTADDLAFLRDPSEFRNVLLVEQPNGNFADTMARQFYFDVWHHLLLTELSNSADQTIAGIAGKALKEVTYHRERSTGWVIRLGDGTDESHQRMQSALDDLWTYTGELFETDSTLHDPWLTDVKKVLNTATVTIPTTTSSRSGGKNRLHSEDFVLLLAEMQFLQRAFPGAQW